MVHDLESGRREPLGQGELPFYSPSGHLVYQAGPSTFDIWAAPFSLDKLKPAGPAFPVARNGRHPTVSADGTLTYLEAASPNVMLVWRDRDGNRLGSAGEPLGSYLETRDPAISPDGRKAAVDVRGVGEADVWIQEAGAPVGMRLITIEGPEPGRIWSRPAFPTWSADGNRITLTSYGKAGAEILVASADGRGQPAVLIEASKENQYLTDWSPDGDVLILTREMPSGWAVVALTRTEGATGYDEVLFLENARPARLSPDGRYIAYESGYTGRDEVYIRSFPGGAAETRVSVNGGAQIRWRKDGKELFFVAGDTLMAVPISTQPNLSVGRPRALFSADRLRRDLGGAGGTSHFYDVSADGQRFVVVEKASPAEGGESVAIQVVQYWYEEFRTRERD